MKVLSFSIALMILAAVFSGSSMGNIFEFTPSNIPVLMKYGAMVVAFTLLRAILSSTLRDSVQPITAHLLAQYTESLGTPSIPAAEAMLQICPLLRAIISGIIASATSIGAVALTSIVIRMSLSF